MEPLTNDEDYSSHGFPTGPGGFMVSILTRKRARVNEIEVEEDTMLGKHNNRPKKPILTLDALMDKLVDMSITLESQHELLQVIPEIRASINTVTSDVAALKTATDSLRLTTSTLIDKSDVLSFENEALSGQFLYWKLVSISCPWLEMLLSSQINERSLACIMKLPSLGTIWVD